MTSFSYSTLSAPGRTTGRDPRGNMGRVPIVSRKDFLDEWDYQNGQHLTMIGPTQRGKTTFGIQLLKKSISPERRVLMLAGKPPKRDSSMQRAAEFLNLRVVDEWPPDTILGDRKKCGWVLRPKQEMKDLAADQREVETQFKKGMMHAYATSPDKPMILYVDEAHLVQNDLHLKAEFEAPLMRGAPDCAVWTNIQRGRYVTYHAYSAPEHLFLFYDPDRSNRERYADIGGVDPRSLMDLSEQLKMYEVSDGKRKNTISQCIYIRRSGPYVCIIDVA